LNSVCLLVGRCEQLHLLLSDRSSVLESLVFGMGNGGAVRILILYCELY